MVPMPANRSMNTSEIKAIENQKMDKEVTSILNKVSIQFQWLYYILFLNSMEK